MALAEGYQSFTKATAKAQQAGEYSRTPAATSIIARGITDVEQSILAWIDQQTKTDANSKRSSKKQWQGRKQHLKHFATKWFQQCGPSTVAYIGLKVVLDGILKRSKYTKVCLTIAGRIVDELRYRKLKEQVPELLEWKLAQFSTNNYQHMQKSLDHTVRTMIDPNEITGYDLTVQRRLQLGALVVDFLMPTQLFTFETLRGGVAMENRPAKNRHEWAAVQNPMHTDKYIVGTEETQEWLLQKNEQAAWRQEQNVPMVVPPLDWQFGRRGGYLFALRGKYPLVRMGFAYTYEKPEQTNLPLIYETLNALQRTPWTINRAVYAAMEEEYSREMLNRPTLPPKPEDIDTNEEARLVWKKQAAKVYNVLHRWKTDMRKRRRVLDTAEALLGVERFYFPYSLDFRGRIYPMADYLHPQADDPSRALLLLAESKEITSENQGDGWLAVHGANCFGEDAGRKMSRLSFAERVAWVDANEARILAAASSPSSARWWTEADDSWQFLAFAFEWQALLHADHEQRPFASRVPVYLDGTCNGLQHFSAAFRDDLGGRAVNLVPSERPNDIYQRVADRVLEGLVSSTDPLAPKILALGIVNRKLAKRPTMTFCYGSKVFGFKRQLREYLKGLDAWPHIAEVLTDEESGKSQVGMACALLAYALWSALTDEVVAAVDGMQWMQDCAAILAHDTNSVEWTVPMTGLPVRQGYVALERDRIVTILMGEIVRSRVAIANKDRKINRRKEQNAVSPNVVHSLDAAALVLAVVNAKREGVRSFAMVHDSYGTVAADVGALNKATREGFVALYNNDVIEDLYEQWQRQTSEELPVPPAKGSLDLQAVLKSKYFFA